MKITYIEKEVLVDLIKKVFASRKVAWSGIFGLSKNRIDDIAYLCWVMNNKDSMGASSWNLYTDSIRHYGLKELKRLALL